MFNESTETEGHTRLLEKPVKLIEETEEVDEGTAGLEEKIKNLESCVEGIATRLDELRDRSAAADKRREQIFNLHIMQLEGLTKILKFVNRIAK